MFRVRYSLRGVSLLLHRIGYSPQVPVRRAVERGEQALPAWRTKRWPEIKRRPQISAHGSCSPTKLARRQDPEGMQLGTKRTHPASEGRGLWLRAVSLAGMSAIKPGACTHMIYRTIVHHEPRYEKPSFREKSFESLLDPAHQQSCGSALLVWDDST
jgi:Winged helix-turn helix